MNFKKLERDMDWWYDYYYNNADDPRIHSDMEEWCGYFDDEMKGNGDFKDDVIEFEHARGDWITSDREAAAFMRAYDTVM